MQHQILVVSLVIRAPVQSDKARAVSVHCELRHQHQHLVSVHERHLAESKEIVEPCLDPAVLLLHPGHLRVKVLPDQGKRCRLVIAPGSELPRGRLKEPDHCPVPSPVLSGERSRICHGSQKLFPVLDLLRDLLLHTFLRILFAQGPYDLQKSHQIREIIRSLEIFLHLALEPVKQHPKQ